jgi:hypothetical protein
MPSTRNLVSLVEAKVVNTNVMAAAPDDANDGVSILSWRSTDEYSGAYAMVAVTGDTIGTVTAPVGGQGVEIWGYRLGKWWLISELRDGRDIAVGPLRGYAQAVNIIGVFERLAVVGTVSAGVATARLAPIELWS